jgi:16S rRNA (cytosine1402-N4)-methyltransferase
MSGPLPRPLETGLPPDPHVPVLIEAILRACAPVSGVWLDGTLGAGGYSRALLAAGADRVIGVDRDPLALQMASGWVGAFGDRVRLAAGTFSDLDELAGEPLDGVVLDLGVSSMQLDQAERGFSFMKDGPLDMRMSQEGPSAADLVNSLDEGVLADILYHYGEERASRRIAHAIVMARGAAPITRTGQLADIVAKCLPRPKPGQSHPATRSFQAIRIAVNAEFSELAEGLQAAERALRPGGLLAVVTFHSLEDRVVKRFFQLASGHEANANRYAPAKADTLARFDMVTRKAVAPDEAELARNPRARSAKLRVGRRTAVPAQGMSSADLGLPEIQKKGRR